MPTEFTKGDMFAEPFGARVNAVNTQGVMGKGLAAEFKRRYPAMFRAYAAECRHGLYVPGVVARHVTVSGLADGLGGQTVVYNAFTKGAWRQPSCYEWVESCLRHLRDHLNNDWERPPGCGVVRSVAVPALGCGLGGLSWSRVRPMVVDALGGLAGAGGGVRAGVRRWAGQHATSRGRSPSATA